MSSINEGVETFFMMLVIAFLFGWWWFPRKPPLPMEGVYGGIQINYKNGQIKLVGKSGWIPLNKENHHLTEKGLWLRKKNIIIHRRKESESPEELFVMNLYPGKRYPV